MSIDDRGYPQPPSVETQELEFELPENPFVRRCAELEKRTSQLEAFCKGLLYANAALVTALRENGGLDASHAAGVLHRFSTPMPKGLDTDLQQAFQVPFEQLRSCLIPPQGSAPDNVVPLQPSPPKSPQD